MSAGLVVAGGVALLVVGLLLGAFVRGVFQVMYGAWLLFWDEVGYVVRRLIYVVGLVALVAGAVALVWHLVK